MLNWWRRQSFAFRQSLMIFIGVFVIVLLFAFLIVERVSYAMNSEVELAASNSLATAAGKIDAAFTGIRIEAEHVAQVLNMFEMDEAAKKHLLGNAIRKAFWESGCVFGGSISYDLSDKKSPDGKNQYLMHYMYYRNKSLEYASLGSEKYNYYEQDWFKIPKTARYKIFWTEPYWDVGGGNVFMTTCSVPFVGKGVVDTDFSGVVTMDVSLNWLTRIMEQIKIDGVGDAMLISGSGDIITTTASDHWLTKNIFQLTCNIVGHQDGGLAERVLSGDAGSAKLRHAGPDNEDYMIFFMPIKSTKWSLAVLMPSKILYRHINTLQWRIYTIGILGVIGMLLTAIFFTKRATAPLTDLKKALCHFGCGGNFDAVELPPVRYHDEIGSLTDAFCKMQTQLREYLKQKNEAESSRQKIESELNVAKSIQMGILPKLRAPYSNNNRFSLAAKLEPAKEVGGDLYDFKLLDERKICLVIGDVSGKGVPAALVMAMVETLIRTESDHSQDPAQIMRNVNEALLQNNDMMMFVTCFIAIVDIESGEGCYTCAGHNPPYLIHSDNTLEKLGVLHGPPLGIKSNLKYGSTKFVIRGNEILLMFTDGVNEAFNNSGVEYGMGRFCNVMRNLPEHDVAVTLQMVEEDLQKFVNGAEQSDDVTMLIFRYNPAAKNELKD
ncbi:MAG: SpoIIE family protein phosphatase [Lentisphaeria bacterium]|nr:SpoIIE family protein phosphatase [Lentisphaeria bacterium]